MVFPQLKGGGGGGSISCQLRYQAKASQQLKLGSYIVLHISGSIASVICSPYNALALS